MNQLLDNLPNTDTKCIVKKTTKNDPFIKNFGGNQKMASLTVNSTIIGIKNNYTINYINYIKLTLFIALNPKPEDF